MCNCLVLKDFNFEKRIILKFVDIRLNIYEKYEI